MATIDGIGLAEPSTITKSLAAIPITRNSTLLHQEIMSIGSPNSTTLLALAEVTGADPASTTVGLVVREVNRNVYQSTAADLQATVTPVAGSTWRVQPGSTLWASSAGFHFDSSGALQVTGATASTVVTVARMVGNSSAADFMPVRLVDSSGTGFLTPGNEYTNASTYSSFSGPTLTYDNSSNNTYRAVGLSTPLPVQLRPGITTYNSTTNLITSTNTTAVYAIVSSAAATRQKVYAYSITSTHAVPSTMLFLSSLGQTIWAVQFGSGSSGVTGANLAVSPPAYLFATEAAAALNVVIENGSSAGSTVIARLSISYLSEA